MKCRGLFTKVVLVLLVVSLGFLGVGKVFFSKEEASVAEVGKQKITLQEYRDQYYEEVQYIQRMIGRALSEEQIRELDVKYSVLNRLIEGKALLGLVDELRLKVGMGSVLHHTQNIKFFQDSNGQFDKAKFKNALLNAGITEGKYVEGLERSFPVAIFMNSLFGEDSNAYLPFSDDIIEKIYKYRNQERITDIVTISSSSVSNNDLIPKDEELEEIYEKNKYSLSNPEYRKIRYISVSAEDVNGLVSVADEEINDLIINDGAENQLDIFNLVFSDSEKAEKAGQAIKDGVTFEQVVVDFGQSKLEEVLLENVTANVLPENVRDQIFSLKEGEVSPVLKSIFGWHIIKVKSIHTISEQDRKELVVNTRDYLSQQKSFELMAKLVEKADFQINQGMKIDEVAAANNLVVMDVVPVDIKGRDDRGNKADNLPSSEDFIATVFAQDSDKVSNFVPVDNNYYSIVVVEIIQSRTRSFEESKDEVKKIWHAKITSEKMIELAKNIAANMKIGLDVSKLPGVKLQVRQPVYRNNMAYMDKTDQNYPNALVDQIFKLNRGGSTNPVPFKDEVMIAVLRDVKDVTENSEFGLKTLKDELSAESINALREQMLRSLLVRYQVKVNKDLVDKVK